MNYTKGEWRLDPQGSEWVVDQEGFGIAKVVDGRTGKFNVANARLMAASKAMYEACKAAQALLVFAATRDRPLAGAAEVNNALRQALAKAEGR